MPTDLTLKAVLCQRFLTWLRQPLPAPDKAISAAQLLLVRAADSQIGRLRARMAQGLQLTRWSWGGSSFPPPSFPSRHPDAGSLICRLGTLQASDGSCRARDSNHLSLAGSSIVHAQIEQKRNQILICCQLALFHCLHQESSSHSQDCSVLGSAGSGNKENTFVSLTSQHFQTDL